jgi:hypothetical protein
MQRAVCILVFLISCFLISLPSVHSQKGVASFSIQYNHAGLRMIEVKDGQLHYVWHSLRQFGEGEPMVMRQDLSSYDRYEAHLWLTQQELKRFQDWIAEHKVFRFKPVYKPPTELRTYGVAFKTSISVTQGDKTHSIEWTGDSKIPDRLEKAVDQLVKLCEEVQTSRKERE